MTLAMGSGRAQYPHFTGRAYYGVAGLGNSLPIQKFAAVFWRHSVL